jgi:hypothetical protein
MDYSKIVREIKATLHEIHKEHIWPRQRDDRPAFRLLIALQRDDPPLRSLFVTSNSVVLPVREFQTIGVGSYLADYLIGRIYPRGSIYNAKTEEVVRAAIAVLYQVKQSIAGCDDETLLMVYYANGKHEVLVGSPVHEVESWFLSLDAAFAPIFRTVAHRELSREEVDGRIKRFSEDILKIRDRQEFMAAIGAKASKRKRAKER